MRPFTTGSDYVNQTGLETDKGSERIKLWGDSLVEGAVRSGLVGGGRWIRTLGPPWGRAFLRLPRSSFLAVRGMGSFGLARLFEILGKSFAAPQ